MTRLLQGYLGSGEVLTRLQEHAARLGRLQATLEQVLPTTLTGTCSVANLRGDTLVLLARNGASAARVKQLLPTMLQQFADAGTLLRKIEVKVTVQNTPEPPQPRAARLLSEAGRQSLEALSASLPADAPLKASLERLIRRSRGE